MADDEQHTAEVAPEAASAPERAPVSPVVVPGAPVAASAPSGVPSSPVVDDAANDAANDADEAVIDRRSVHAGEVAALIPALASVAFAQGRYEVEQLASGVWRLADEGLRLAYAAAFAQHDAARATASHAFADALAAIEGAAEGAEGPVED